MSPIPLREIVAPCHVRRHALVAPNTCVRPTGAHPLAGPVVDDGEPPEPLGGVAGGSTPECLLA